MDYWCALWFWPIDKADLLPSRSEFLMHLSLILEGNLIPTAPAQRPLFVENDAEKQLQALFSDLDLVDLDALCEKLEPLRVVREVAQRIAFFPLGAGVRRRFRRARRLRPHPREPPLDQAGMGGGRDPLGRGTALRDPEVLR